MPQSVPKPTQVANREAPQLSLSKVPQKWVQKAFLISYFNNARNSKLSKYE